MSKVKRSLAYLLVGALLFSFITVLSFADVDIPQGPIDSVDKDNGINQIMQAGVEDKSFATAIYESFARDGYYGDETKNVREILGEYTGIIEASNRGIKSIVGIEWLRKIAKIDLSNRGDDQTGIKNEVSDLTPISMKYITKLAGITENEAKLWFGDKKVVEVDISGNPIKYYANSVGLLRLIFSDQPSPMVETDNLNAIKTGHVTDWSVDKKINFPKLYKDGLEVYFSDDENATTIHYPDTTINDDAYINYQVIKDYILEIKNIKRSGELVAWSTAEEALNYWKANPVGSGVGPSEDQITFIYQTAFTARIYTPVYIDKKVKRNFKVTKSATCDYSGKKVVGAKYHLYNAKTNALVSNREYITDENGEFLIDESLPIGEYYLKEFEAPDGFLLNEKLISFSIVADKCTVSVTGGDKNLNINAGDIKEDPNTVYIDRNSKDVTVSIEDDENYKLNRIEVTYFDRETQEFKNMTTTGPSPDTAFESVSDASVWISNWINTNKGNAETPGIIDGEVRIEAFFEHKKEILTSDPRPTIGVEFKKVGSNLNENGELVQKPLPDIKFKLQCTHEHDEHCKDASGGYGQCTDPHTDCGDFITDLGCSWNDEIASDGDGNVIFKDINTGTYKLSEVEVPEGYLEPSTWTVNVNASEGTFEIIADDEDSNIEGNQQDGYTIVNETFNVKVVKISSETGETLKGAVFVLSQKIGDQWGNEKTATTGDDGFAYFKELTKGQYKIKEIEAPPGYELITDTIEFKVPFEYTSTDKNGIQTDFSSDTKIVTFTVSDKVGVNLPNTGATLTARIATLGIVIMGIMVIILKKQKIKNKQEI